jgi:RNA polymerase sigma-54 factor
MSSSQRLELRQGQSLTMTPQLLQSIKLLQLSHLELAAFIDAELERNPLLQHADESPDAAPLDPKARAARQSDRMIRRIFPSAGARHPQGLSAKSKQPGGSVAGEGSVDLDATNAGRVSLADHLESQLDLATTDVPLRQAGRYIIHSLSEAGYLVDDTKEIAEALDLDIETVLTALRLVQSFDPPGIGARDLAECLRIQLVERGRIDAAMDILLARLDLLARHDHGALRGLCGVDESALNAMIAEIRSLEPKPGLAFGSAPIDALVPDVFVRNADGGGFEIELNGTTVPRLSVDRSYHAQIAPSARSKADQAFLGECMRSAAWLARTLDQRATTIFKVASEIVRRQESFFHHGAGQLRPLTLRSVAEAIGMHESTVSRVTANKSLGSDRGTFPMKYFFSTSLSGADGTPAHSSEAVRHRIKGLIAAEKRGAVLSDDAIAQNLRASGVDIARRTVAKYREALRIPTSSQRRRTRQATTPSP